MTPINENINIIKAGSLIVEYKLVLLVVCSESSTLFEFEIVLFEYSFVEFKLKLTNLI